MATLAERIKVRARAAGFELVGICQPAPSPRAAAAYLAWLQAGMAGEMNYMARPDRVSRALDPAVSAPDPAASAPDPAARPGPARSVIAVGKNYFARGVPPEVRDDPSRGIIASYAWGADYHDVIMPRLQALCAGLAGLLGRSVAGRVLVDTGPLLERDTAARAGLGFIGRNTMLIHPRRGSWLFLGAVLVDVVLEPDREAQRGTCGGCSRCLAACPTDAFPAPYVLDARRCISYLTIELRGPIPRELRPGIGNRIFGCDVCNAVCPYNQRFARVTDDAELRPDPDQMAPRLLDLLGLDDAAFRARFAGTPIARAKRRGLLRNVCVALGNWGSAEAASGLAAAQGDDEPLVRGHAAWALGRVATRAARAALQAALAREPDAWVREELALALAG